MKRSEAVEFAKVVLAYSEGKKIQYRARYQEKEWMEVYDDTYIAFDTDIWEYRIKPQPYRCKAVLNIVNRIVEIYEEGDDSNAEINVHEVNGERLVTLVEENVDDAV